MLRYVSAVAFLFVFMVAANAFAQDQFDYVCDYEFPATPVVHCVDGNGDFEHNIYYFAAGNNKCLVVVCHGFHNSDGYGILMHNSFRHDYARAVSESIAYWTRQGKLRNVGNFDYVFMSTCYSGYAESSVTLPTYNIPLARAIDYKGITAFSEVPYQNGQVLIRLYRAVPKYSTVNTRSTGGNLSKFLQKHRVKGYRAVGTRSSSKPDGLIILSGEL